MLTIEIHNEVTPALDEFRDRLLQKMATTAGEIRDIVVVRATTEYMREFRTDEVETPASRELTLPLIHRFKFHNDTPILRRLTGRLTHSLLGERQGGLTPAFIASSGNETIHELTVSGEGVRLRFGSKTPYAAIHEFGGLAGRGHNVRIRARPYLRPAIRDVEPIAGRLVQQRIQELASEVGL